MTTRRKPTRLFLACLAGAIAACSLAANEAAASPTLIGAPVHYKVVAGDGPMFYTTRALQKGDRFEVKAHHLQDYARLVVVPCRPGCDHPDIAYSYVLQSGNQQLQVPMSGQYMFWLERIRINGGGIPIREGWTRTPLKVEVSDDRGDLFAARFEGGAEVWLRTLDSHAGPLPAGYRATD